MKTSFHCDQFYLAVETSDGPHQNPKPLHELNKFLLSEDKGAKQIQPAFFFCAAASRFLYNGQ